jgi:hypothetical protein
VKFIKVPDGTASAAIEQTIRDLLTGQQAIPKEPV